MVDLVNIIFYLLVLAIGLFVLGKSAHYLIIAVTRLGNNLRISQFITGFVILGIATSLPEIFIGINSALTDIPQLSLGNLLGANIVLLTLIAGSAALLNRGINVKQEFGHGGRLLQIVTLILAPLIVLLDSHLSRIDSLFLVILYVGYLIYVYKFTPKDSPPVGTSLMNHKFLHTLFLCIAGFLGLIVASKAVVFSSLKMATMFNIPTVIVGTLLLSLGTNLPEISVVIAAVKKHRTNLVIGDVLGSASTNTLVIAMVGLIKPFTLSNPEIFRSTAIFMTVAVVLFFLLTKSKNKLTVVEGLILLTLYLVFILSEVFLLKH
jgi:cation:H+ antiporter